MGIVSTINSLFQLRVVNYFTSVPRSSNSLVETTTGFQAKRKRQPVQEDFNSSFWAPDSQNQLSWLLTPRMSSGGSLGREVENYIPCHLCQQPVNTTWFTHRMSYCLALWKEFIHDAFNRLLDHCALSDSNFSWPENLSDIWHLLDWAAPFIVGGGTKLCSQYQGDSRSRVTDSRLRSQCFS